MIIRLTLAIGWPQVGVIALVLLVCSFVGGYARAIADRSFRKIGGDRR